MDDDSVCPVIDRESKKGAGCRYRGHYPEDLRRTLDLQSIWTVVTRAFDFENFVEFGHQLEEIHGPMVPQWPLRRSRMVGIMRGFALSFVVSIALVLAMVGCGPEKREPEAPRFSVRLMTSLAISGRWESDAERGLGRIAAELDADVARIRIGTDGGSRSRLAEQGAAGIDVVFCVGSGFEKTIYSEAAAYPDTVFVLIPGQARGANVAGIDFLTEGAGYLAGVAAEVVASDHRVGLLRGDGRPWLESLEEGFIGGFKSRHRRASVETGDGVEGVAEFLASGIEIAFYCFAITHSPGG